MNDNERDGGALRAAWAAAGRALAEFGLPRLIITGFVLSLLLLALITKMDLTILLSDSLVRIGMNGLLVLAMLAAIALITVVVAVFMGWLGIPLLSLMYGIGFEQFRSLTYVMVAAGGICDARSVAAAFCLGAAGVQVVALAFSMPVALLLVNFAELSGAVVASLVSMAILFVLLVSEYATIRRRLERGY